METQEPSRGRSPKWKRRHRRIRHRSRRPFFSARGRRYAQWTVIVLAVALLGRLAWQGMYSVLHPARTHLATQSAPAFDAEHSLPVDAIPWQRDVLEAIEESRAAAQSGFIGNADTAADRAASTIVVARMRSQIATPDFFAVASTALDQVLQQRPGNERLFEHVTNARIELAQLRTWQNSAGSNLPEAEPNASPNVAMAGQDRLQGTAVAASGRSLPGHIAIDAPRSLAANQTLTPKMLGGNYLDATLMADSAEILLPPSSRMLTDNVGIADLTIAGAAQTLDNMHWKNVTFVGTRLQFGGGGIDLQNVHFIRCTFVFPPDLRGAILAKAIALGQSTITIE